MTWPTDLTPEACATEDGQVVFTATALGGVERT
jgi:hypothetical protein